MTIEEKKLESSNCSDCGAELSHSTGHCLACLLQLGLDAGMEEIPLLNSGDWVGRYELLEQIGEGGCGVVFMAEQSQPVRRRVALKVIKPGMDTRQVIARFEAERQALAMLDHPNIAKIFDAGATESGHPFFVMELVRGVKITDYCDQQKLSVRERIELLAQICHAVQYAHQKGIIHRDLKPSNILVGEDGRPTIIDFGIAKSMERPLTEKTLFTAFQQFIGTPAYMSPEQAGTGDVDTRADIYSLGILLYELLTGLTPFDAEELRRLAPDEILRFIRNAEPLRPSARLTRLTHSQLSNIAQCRRIEPTKFLHLLRGDLDRIVMKCLEKEPASRYETASSLALDLQRYLAHEPVSARPPGHWYRFEKMVRRNRVVAGAAAAIALALILGTIVSAYQAVRAGRAEQEQAQLRREAQAEAAKNAEVAQFLKAILQGAGPSVALGRDTTMLREILDRAAARLSRDLTNQPEAQAELFSTLADTYHQLGFYEKMEAMARESLRLSRSKSGVENIAVIRALAQIGDADEHLGKLDEAERFTRQALEMRRKLPGDAEPELSGLINNLGLVLREQGRLREAEILFRDALAMDQKKSGGSGEKAATDLSNLGAVLLSEGQLEEAESKYRDTLALRRKIFGDEHPEVAIALGNLSVVLARERKFAESEATARETLALDRKFLSADHPDLPLALANLASVFAAQGKWPEAEAADREALADYQKLSGTNHTEESATLENLAKDLSQQGRLAEAETLKNKMQAIGK
ncbi:MAG TPA: serine/threonine-protein kinase [Verrucomicrobiae bacterium]|nr:serine/threonine-protein kinase [Verrucomicrobiae bacterium]